MRTIHETTEDLERHLSPLFYGEVVLHSSSTNSYDLDPNVIERPPAITTVEAELLFLENKPSCLPRFESKSDKTIAASRNKKIISSKKELELPCNEHDVEYLPPTPGELPNSTKTRRRKLKRKCSPHQVAEDNQNRRNKRSARSPQQEAEDN